MSEWNSAQDPSPRTPVGALLAAGCGGALFGVSLGSVIGGGAIWLWLNQTAKNSKGTPETILVGIAFASLAGLVALLIFSILMGMLSGAVCMNAAHRLGRVPIAALLGFPLALVEICVLAAVLRPNRHVYPPGSPPAGVTGAASTMPAPGQPGAASSP